MDDDEFDAFDSLAAAKPTKRSTFTRVATHDDDTIARRNVLRAQLKQLQSPPQPIKPAPEPDAIIIDTPPLARASEAEMAALDEEDEPDNNKLDEAPSDMRRRQILQHLLLAPVES